METNQSHSTDSNQGSALGTKDKKEETIVKLVWVSQPSFPLGDTSPGRDVGIGKGDGDDDDGGGSS